MRGIKDHAAGGKTINVRRVEGRLWIVKFEVEGRLVVNEDEENVWSARLCGVGEEREDEKSEDMFHGMS